MKPAIKSTRRFENSKLLVLSDQAQVGHSHLGQLTQHLNAGDLIVVNRSGTLPSSFRGTVRGQPIEIRLASYLGKGLAHWMAFSFGEGDWTWPTEKRGRPPELKPGDHIIFGPDLFAQVEAVNQERLIQLTFQSSALERNLYKYGEPIQYSYLTEKLNIWDQQTIFSGPPISVEAPSSAFPFNWNMVTQLRAQGVEFASLLHGAGISSTGDSRLDQLLPLREWYEVPKTTVNAIERAKAKGSRVLALGTTVVRALESAGLSGELLPGAGYTELKISPKHDLRVVDSLITGMHELGSSHIKLVEAFCPPCTIEEGYRQAQAKNYLGHEYGDLTLMTCTGEILSKK